MTIFIILLLSLLCVWWYIEHNKEEANRKQRLIQFNKERKIYSEEYTSGKYDFETYKHNISNLHSKYRV